MIDTIMKYINGIVNPQGTKSDMTGEYKISPSGNNTLQYQVNFSTEPSNVRLTPVLEPYIYNNTVNGVKFNSQ